MRQPTEMEIRVAKAIATDVGACWEDWIGTARKAIRQLYDPTEEMLDAAYKQMTEPDTFDLDAFPEDVPVVAEIAWQTMLDVASPPEQS